MFKLLQRWTTQLLEKYSYRTSANSEPEQGHHISVHATFKGNNS